MKEKLKNKKVVYTIIGIVSVLLVALAVTYAYWLVTKTQTGENAISSACLDIAISGEKNDIELTNQFPISNEEGMKLVPYEFTVTNNCNTSVDYQVALEATGDESAAMATSSLKVALDDSVSLLSSNAEVATTIAGAYESRVLGYSRLAAAGNEGSSVTYKLRLWIDEDAPISEMNKTFTSKISVTIGQGIESPYDEGTLAYDILLNNGGVNAVSEIDVNELDHRITTTGNQYIYSSGNYYYGTDYTFDETTGKYTLSGTLTQAKLEECRNGTKTCGKYTLNDSSPTYSKSWIYEVTDWNSSHGTDWVIANEIEYTNAFDGIIISDDEKGLYKTQDDLGNSYYFRGNVTNNYVQFGEKQEVFVSYEGDKYTYSNYDLCLEKWSADECKVNNSTFYWRIVRINGDGTIRLIFDGKEKVENNTQHSFSVGHTEFNYGYDDEKYVGYTYDDGTGTQVDSAVKSVADAWYDTNLKANYGKYIADSIFCNDRSIDSYRYEDEEWSEIITENKPSVENYGIRYGAYERLYLNKAPSLKCANQSDRYTVEDTTNGNGLLSNPIGLITADELLFGVGYLTPTAYYTYYWTLTPGVWNEHGDGYAQVWTLTGTGGNISLNPIDIPKDVRPVINLKSDVKFTGDGTIDNPYVIVTE